MSLYTVVHSVIVTLNVYAHKTDIWCAQFVNVKGSQLHIAEAQIQCCVKRSGPKSLLHSQELPLE